MARAFVLMGVALVAIAGLFSFKSLVSERRHELALAQHGVRQAALHAEEQLQSRVQIAANNSMFLKNLDWGLAHSVNQALAGMLEQGSLDELHLHDANCQVMAQAIQGPASGLDCPLRVLPESQWKQAYWFTNRDQVNIAFSRTVNVGTQGIYYLSAVAKLTPAWLRSRTSSTGLIDELNLKLVPSASYESGLIIDRLGLHRGEKQGAMLVSDDRIANWFPRLMQPGGMRLDPYIWLALLVAAVGLLYTWWRTNAALTTVSTQRRSLIEWCRSVGQSGGSSGPVAASHLTDPELSLALGTIASGMAERADAMSGLQNEFMRLTAELKERDDELTDYQGQLSELAELESFALQIRGTSARFLDKLTGVGDGLDHVLGLAGHSIGGHARNLRTLINTWRQQMAERTARRFLRSLAEATAADGRSELEVQLELIANTCGQVLRDSERMIAHAQTMKSGLQSALTIAAHWHGLALRESDSQGATSILEAALGAQDLYTANEHGEVLQFVNVMGLVYQGRLPTVPQVVLTSALYHLCEAVGVQVAERAVQERMVRLQVLDHDDRSYILIGTDDPVAFDPSVDALCQEDYHFRISRQLLANFAMKVQPLCAAPGHVLFAISWVRHLGDAAEIDTNQLTNVRRDGALQAFDS